MGFGKTITTKPEPKPKLTDHPNFSLPAPELGESAISFAMRCAAHAVSPPQDAGESYEVECVDVAQQLRDLTEAVEAKWFSRDHFGKVNVVLKKHPDAVCVKRNELKWEVMDSTREDAKVIGVAATSEFAWSDAAGRIRSERIPGPPDPPKGPSPREWG